MVTYVYDYPNGGPARFYIEGDYVIPVFGTQPAFWINGEYWYPTPPTGNPSISGERHISFIRTGSPGRRSIIANEPPQLAC